MNQAPQIQLTPLTKAVKALIVINVAVWLLLVLVLQGMVLHNNFVFDGFALIPRRVIYDFWIWQLVTYMFVHSASVTHVLFNMLVLWWCGGELESRWGTPFFLKYYFTCGLGAGLIYLLGTFIYVLVSGNVMPMDSFLVGASGATYGLLLAYGILFGDRVIHFMMLFPMKARYFVMILGAVELVTLMDVGTSSQVANLAHLGGIGVGFVTLMVVARYRAAKTQAGKSRGRRLKLVVDNERRSEEDPKKGPKYWN